MQQRGSAHRAQLGHPDQAARGVEDLAGAWRPRRVSPVSEEAQPPSALGRRDAGVCRAENGAGARRRCAAWPGSLMCSRADPGRRLPCRPPARPPPRAQGRLPGSCLCDVSVPAGGEGRRAERPSLRGLVCHRPVTLLRHQPEFALWPEVALPESGRRFSWVMVPGVGAVLNLGQLPSWAGWLLLVGVNQLLRPVTYCLGLRSCLQTAEYRPQSPE